MNSYISDAFNQQTNGARLLRVFENMASTITREYEKEINEFIDRNGYAPSFVELFEKFKGLNADLNAKASLILNDYRESKGHKSIQLTTGCKRIMRNSVNEFLQHVKILLNQKGFSATAFFKMTFKDL